MKSTKKFYDMPFAGLCGVFLDEVAMKKVAKLVYRQNQELKELLTENIDHIEISNWTLAYPNGNQEVIHYISNDRPWESKDKRIALIDRMSNVKMVKHLYYGTDEEAIEEHMKLHDEITEVVIEEAN